MALYRGPGGSGDATNDATSQSIIATQAAIEAASSAIQAAASAINASNSATAASNSASAASTSATNASNFADDAADYATAAASALDEFTDFYLGAKTTNPSVDNDGNALQTGALYFNTVANEFRVYTGFEWQVITIGAVGDSVITQRFSGDGSTVAFTLSTEPFSENSTFVYINGAYQQKNTYNVSGLTLTFSEAPPTGTDNIEVLTITMVDIDNITASIINITDSGGYYVSSKVEGALQETATFTQSGTGAVLRTKTDKLKETVSVKDFGAVGDGVTDDTAAIQAALNSASTGMAVVIPGDMRCYVASSITVPNGVSIVGYAQSSGRSQQTLLTTGSAIILNSAATINLNRAASLEGLCITRQGLTIPLTSAQIISTFLGQAITLLNNAADIRVSDCTIVGFYTGIANNAGQVATRYTLNNILIDCRNGVSLTGSGDIARITDVHCVPALTANGAPDGWNNIRTGLIAFNIFGANDWTKLTNCFCYGFKTGYKLNGAGAVILTGCASDYTPVNPSYPGASPSRPVATDGSIGFHITGTSAEIIFIGCQSAASDTGFYIDTTAGYNTIKISDSNSWDHYVNNIDVVRGSVYVINHYFRDQNKYSTGITTRSTATSLNVSTCTFLNTDYGIVQETSSTNMKHTGITYINVIPSNRIVNPYIPTILTQDPLELDGNNYVFNVSGTTGFGSIFADDSTYVGKIIVLKFLDSVTVYDGGGSLYLNGSFSATAGDTLTLISDGTAFYEVSRSVN